MLLESTSFFVNLIREQCESARSATGSRKEVPVVCECIVHAVQDDEDPLKRNVMKQIGRSSIQMVFPIVQRNGR